MTFTLPFFPEEASSIAGEVDAIFAAWLAVALFFTVLIAVLIVVFMVKYKRRAANEVGASDHAGMWLEITWSVIPLLIMLVMFGWGARLFFEVHRRPAGAVQYWAVAKQWMWKFQHPEGNREINHLHLPLGQTVQLTMTSEDVIHAFSVPAFRVKQDVVPGTYTSIWFKPTRIGEYHLFCDQYCGAEHSKMVGSVTVMAPEAYAAWLAGNPSPGESPVMAGAQLFKTFACYTCHDPGPGRPARGPNLRGVFGQQIPLEGGGTVLADEAYVRESILLPMAKVVRGWQPVMPTFQGQVSEEQMAALVAYIKSMGLDTAQGGGGSVVTESSSGTMGPTGTTGTTGTTGSVRGGTPPPPSGPASGTQK